MRRLYISAIFAVLGAIFSIGWGLDLLVASQEGEHEADNIATYQRILDGAANQLANASASKLQEQAQEISSDFSITLHLEHTNNVALPSSLQQQLSQPGGLLLASQDASYLLRRINNHPDYLLQLKLSTVEKTNHNTDLLLTVTLYLGVCLIIILWSLPLTRRLYLLNHTAARFGAGEFSARLPKSRFSYIHLLESSFNRMAAQIESLLADNKILARSLSHDIRTPIACLRFGIEAALDTSNLDKKDNYLRRMDSEITRMEQMTSAFLEYAGLERQVGSLRLQEVELNQWLDVIRDELNQFAEKQQIMIYFSSNHDKVFCYIDIQWMHRALQNLLANAIDFAVANVIITLESNQQDIIIKISDDGPGIPDDDLASIFEPFIKLSSRRTREQGHFGLGLAITNKVITWHGGTVKASNNKGTSGACFALTLPNTNNR